MSAFTDAIPAATAAVDPPASLIAAICIAVVALAGVVVYLFKHYQKKLSDFEDDRKRAEAGVTQERINWAVERQRFVDAHEEFEILRDKFESGLRAEYEEKHRVVVQNYARQVN